MTATSFDPLYDPVYNLENLARVGSVKEFDAELKNAHAKGYSFTPQQLEDVEAARIICHRNAIYLLEEPCSAAAQSGNLTVLEDNIRTLTDYYHASNQTIDPARLEDWRKSGASAAISNAVEQAEQFAQAKVTAQRDSLIAKAHEISERYNLPLTAQQQESEQRSLQTSRSHEIATVQSEVIAIVATTASVTGASKLEQVAPRLEAIKRYSQEAGLSTSPEERASFNGQWALQLRNQLLLEAMALAESRGISEQLERSMDSLTSLTSLSGLAISPAEIEAIRVKAATKSLSDLVKQAEQPLSIAAFDRLEGDIHAFIAGAEAKGCTTPLTLSAEQVTTLNKAFLSSRHTTIDKHLKAVESAIQSGSWPNAQRALAQADQVCKDEDVRFQVPADYQVKKIEHISKIGRLKIDEIFEEIAVIVPRGEYTRVGELSANIRVLAKDYGVTLAAADEDIIKEQTRRARQSAIKSLESTTINKIDLTALERDLAAIRGVLRSAGDQAPSLELSQNATKLMRLLSDNG